MLAAFESQERARKIGDILEVCPDVSEADAGRALDLCGGHEADAAAALAGDPAFRRRLMAPMGTASGRPGSGGGGDRDRPAAASRHRQPWAAPLGPRAKPVDPAGLGDGVFIGKFRNGAAYRKPAGGSAPGSRAASAEPSSEDASGSGSGAAAAAAPAAPRPRSRSGSRSGKRKSSASRARAPPPPPPPLPGAVLHRLMKALPDGTMVPALPGEVEAAWAAEAAVAAEAAAKAAAEAAAEAVPAPSAPSATATSSSSDDDDDPASVGALAVRALATAPLANAVTLAGRLPAAAREAALGLLAGENADRARELRDALAVARAPGPKRAAASPPPPPPASRKAAKPRPDSRPTSAAAAAPPRAPPPPPPPAFHDSRPSAAIAAVTARGHVNRGRVRGKSSKQAELVAVGALGPAGAAGWSNSGYIFPAGFASRVSFRSSVQLDSLCVHECRIVGAGGAHWPAPTFEVAAMDRPDEPLVARSCTGCWTGVLKRINAEIEARRAAGEDLPPPPKTAIAGPEYFGFCQPEVAAAVEALDPERTCVDYWRGKEDREAAKAGLPVAARAGAPGRVRAPRPSRAKGARRDRRRDRGGGGHSSDGGPRAGTDDDDGSDPEAGLATRWSAVSRGDRARRRAGADGAPSPDASNPLPGFIDPITLEPVTRPAMSPAGHVMGAATWKAVLAERGACPFTKAPLSWEQCVLLTHANIERYRDRIRQ